MTILHDLKYAVRGVGHTPLVAMVVVVSMAMGVAGAGAVFTIADAAFLGNRAGVDESIRLVEVARTTDSACCDNFSYPDLLTLQDQAAELIDLVGVRLSPEPVAVSSDSAAERLYVSAVGWNYFQLLNVAIPLGRGLLREDDRDGAQPVIVISHGLWKNRFGGRPDVINQHFHLNRRAFSIVGVAPEGFRGHSLAAADLWMPLSIFPASTGRPRDFLTDNRIVWVQAIGRFRDGVTPAMVQARLETIQSSLPTALARPGQKVGVSVVPSGRVPTEFRPVVGTFLMALAAVVGMLLLIACANVAAILLARNASRARELALRTAIGASRAALARQIVVETAVWVVPGSIGGIAGAAGIARTLELARSIVPIPLAVALRVDWRVVAFSILVASAAALLSSLAPVLAVNRLEPAEVLKTDSLSATTGRLRWRQLFVLVQVGVSALLLVAALTLSKSLRSAGAVQRGFPAEGVEVVRTDFRLAGHDAARGSALAERLLEGSRALTNVTSSALAAVVPLSGENLNLGNVNLPGEPETARGLPTEWNVITPEYFQMVGVPLVLGRNFDNRDRMNSPGVAIVNESLARRLFGGSDAVGKVIVQTAARETRALTVVGVAKSSKYRSLGEPERNAAYVPFAQHYHPQTSFLLRVEATRRNSAIPAFRTLVRDQDPNVPVIYAASLQEIMSFGLVPHRIASWIAGAFGAIGIVLAIVGVYGLACYSVEQRRKEIVIRSALGASRLDILRSVAGRVLPLWLTGVVAGALLGGASPMLFAQVFYSQQSFDLGGAIYGATILVVAVVTASTVPILQTDVANPAKWLRSE